MQGIDQDRSVRAVGGGHDRQRVGQSPHPAPRHPFQVDPDAEAGSEIAELGELGRQP
jgi:hypothetical protein